MLRLAVNGMSYRVTPEPEMPLRYVLRNDLELTGARCGCSLGICGTHARILGVVRRAVAESRQ